ncbi:ribonuclease E/G [Tateyamaria sp. ANG-S1]|uniref:ribonuclease E/G n=1 Tax=Tateyamaria sp. ANG-S1 TaxID=1577905 RepID=UPI00057F13E6|nr:ribonuclease E/G [Tateyamaria sp. ANG-S1]KIC51206.1 ribonuclease G [Tateyamaria sp. ANG-S1]
MKGRQILLDHIDGREAAALMVDGHLDDLLIDADAPRPGTIYRAVTDRPVKGQGGIFLKTPDGSAYLRGVKGIGQGEELRVQVTGYAEPGKAIPVTHKILFKSRYAIVTPDAPGLNLSRSIRDDDVRDALLALAHDGMDGSPMGLILRSASAEADLEDVAEDITAMRDLAEAVMGDTGQAPETLSEGDGPHTLAWRDWVAPAQVVTEPGCFEAQGVLDAVDAARGAYVALGGDASMMVEATRALVAVDVNTGSDGSFAAGTRANLACARMLLSALRVRGLGGQITIDLAPMPKKERKTFEAVLRAALRQDDIDTVMAGWTPLGHFELQRKRARIPLSQVLP